MALFTRLDPGAIAQVADRFALGAVVHSDGIEAGTVNSNYRVVTERGAFFVRVNEGKAEADVAYEAELVAYLAERGVATPPALRAQDGRPYAALAQVPGLVTVFPWLEAKALCARQLPPATCARAGETLAKVHLAAQGFGLRRQSHYSFDAIVARHRGLTGQSRDLEVDRAIAETGAEIDRLSTVRGARAALPSGVIHGDLFVDNVLEGEAGLVLLDFEQAADGAFAYDLAVLINAWGFGDHFVPERVAAAIAGYQRVRSLEPAERSGLHTEACAAAMRFTVTRLTDVALNERTTPFVKARKDYRRYQRRLAELRALGPSGFARLGGL
jgi:homoserine kinase type II